MLKKMVIWNDFKSNHKILNQIQIKSRVFQIKSLFFKSNNYVWFHHDLNQTRMRGKAQPNGRPAVELIETLVRLSLIPTRATPLFD